MAKLTTIEASNAAREALEAELSAELDARDLARQAARNALAKAREAARQKRLEINSTHETWRAVETGASELSIAAIFASETDRRTREEIGLSQAGLWESIETSYRAKGAISEAEYLDALVPCDDRPEAMPLFVFSTEAEIKGQRTQAHATFYLTPSRGIYAIVARAEHYSDTTRGVVLSRMLQPSDCSVDFKSRAIAYAMDVWRSMTPADAAAPTGFVWMIDTTPYPGTADKERIRSGNRDHTISLTSIEGLNVRFEGETYQHDVSEGRTRCKRTKGDVRTSGLRLREKATPETFDNWELSNGARLAADVEEEWASRKPKPEPVRIGRVVDPSDKPSAVYWTEPNTNGVASLRHAKTLCGNHVFAGFDDPASITMPNMSAREANALRRSRAYIMMSGFALQA